MENKVYAVVGSKEITEKDVQDFLQNIGPQNAMQFQGEDGIKRIVEELINHELMFLEAKEEKLDEEDVFIREVENMKNNLLKQYAIQKMLSKVEITEDEVKEFYDNNKQFVSQPAKMRASHILVDSEEKAKEIIQNIKDGAAFENQAREHSTCPSCENGGDLGEFPAGSMVPEFEAAAEAMNVGDISEEPVKTQFGYHVIKLIDKKEASTPEFEEIKDQLYNQALGAKQEKVYFAKADELKKKFNVEYK